MRLQNRKIVITGGGSGIGLETARLFHEEGAQICVLDRSPAALDKARNELHGATVLGCDVSIEEEVGRAMEQASQAMGGIDGVCNVAGIGTRKSFAETTLEIMQTDIAINLLGPFIVSKAALPYMQHAGRGTIVNVASGLALRPTEGRTAYGASKGGLVVMSKAMAIDLAADNIRVNVICPGLIDTPLVQNATHGALFSPAQMEKLMERRIIRRLGTADEVAKGILFLTSDESSFMTACVMAVDGGGSMH
jgi:NAD(P)-dependent dehydrogenase (short-subunit alcohol dehydrogenase family)